MPKQEWTESGVGREEDINYNDAAMSPEDRERMHEFQDQMKWFLYAERIRVFFILMIPVVLVAFCCIGVRQCYRRCSCCCNPCRWCYRGFCRICCCCCRRPGDDEPEPTSVKVGDADVDLKYLRQRKELRGAYALWLFGGLGGAHHFYLGRPVHGILSAWSLNFLCLGWLLDMALMPLYVGGSNWEVAYLAKGDGACRRFCCRLPHALVTVGLVYLFLYTQIPDVLQSFHLVDVESIAAETSTNPYDLLRVPRNFTEAELKAAYSHQLQRLPKGILCGKDCEFKKAEYKKSFEFLNGDAWRRPDLGLFAMSKFQREMNDLQRATEPISVSITSGKSFDDDYGEEVPQPEMVSKTMKRTPKKQEEEFEEEGSRDKWDDWSDYLSYEWKALARTAYTRIRPAFEGSAEASEAPEAKQANDKKEKDRQERARSRSEF